MKDRLTDIRNLAYADDFSNRNYEVAVTLLKIVDLMLEDKEKNDANYYEMQICPPKMPNIDAYIICTTDNHKDYALQIKSGQKYDAIVKDNMWNSRHKYPINPDNYLLLTWKKFRTYKGFNYQPNVLDESILDIIEKLEKRRYYFSEEIEFVEKTLKEILEASQNHNEINWILINRELSHIFNKHVLENTFFLP